MKTLIVIIIIALFFAVPALADEPQPRPPAWETVAATKAEVQRIRNTATPTPEPYPYPAPIPYPYPEPEQSPWIIWLLELLK